MAPGTHVRRCGTAGGGPRNGQQRAGGGGARPRQVGSRLGRGHGFYRQRLHSSSQSEKAKIDGGHQQGPCPLHHGAGSSFHSSGADAIWAGVYEECYGALGSGESTPENEREAWPFGFSEGHVPPQQKEVHHQKNPQQQRCSPYSKRAEMTINWGRRPTILCCRTKCVPFNKSIECESYVVKGTKDGFIATKGGAAFESGREVGTLPRHLEGVNK